MENARATTKQIDTIGNLPSLKWYCFSCLDAGFSSEQAAGQVAQDKKIEKKIKNLVFSISSYKNNISASSTKSDHKDCEKNSKMKNQICTQ